MLLRRAPQTASYHCLALLFHALWLQISIMLWTILDTSDFKPGAIHSHQEHKRRFVKYLQVLGCDSRGRGDTPLTLRWAGREIFPHWWLSKQTKIVSTPGNLWPLGLVLIPHLHLLSRFEPKRKVPFWHGDHWRALTAAHSSAHTALTEVTASSEVMLHWSSKI